MITDRDIEKLKTVFTTKQESQQMMSDMMETMEKIFNDFAQRIGVRMDRLEGKIDGLEKRMNSLEKRMDSLEKRMDSLEKRMTNLETRLDSVEGKLIEIILWKPALHNHEARLQMIEKQQIPKS